MPYVQINCPHCQKPVRVDTDKLPDTAALLRCPSCSESMRVEKEKLLANEGPSMPEQPAAAPSPPSQPPPPGADAGNPGAERSKPFLPPYFEIPPDSELPPGLVVSHDDTVVEALQQALEPFGCRLQSLNALANLAEIEEMPEIVACHIASGSDPAEGLRALRDMSPAKRRRSFVMMISDSIPTLDGQEAFLHEVDLILNRADLDVAAEAVFLAFEYRKRLWGPLLAAEDALA